MKSNIILNGDALTKLKELPKKSINMCMTSPPYWALRDYGVDGQLGLEPTFDKYIKKLCDIFDEVKRVLRDDGTCWVNIGDTYNAGRSGGHAGGTKGLDRPENAPKQSGVNAKELPTKSLVMIPFRFAIEMVNRGWILRNTIIWHKRNCMPSSASDRFTVDFEYIFFFSKKKKYYFEQQLDKTLTKDNLVRDRDTTKLNNTPGRTKMGGLKKNDYDFKNKRTTWTINPKPFKEAHFAVYPEELCETPIKAGCPSFVCVKCGNPKIKVFEKKEYVGEEKEVSGKFKGSNVHSAGAREHYLSEQRKYKPEQKKIALFLKEQIKNENAEKELDKEFGNTKWTHWIRIDETGASLPSPEQYKKLKEILFLPDFYDKEMLTTVKVLVDDAGSKEEFKGYKPTCSCDAKFTGGIVLDPFFGAGTTGVVALKQNKKFIGIELNKEYIEIAKNRLRPYLEQRKLA